MTDIQRPDASDYEPGSGDLEYAMALELYVDHLEAELAEAVELLRSAAPHFAGTALSLEEDIEAFLVRQETKHE